MRIAIVTEVFLPKVDGVVARAQRAIEQLVAFGHEVRVYCPPTDRRDYAGAPLCPTYGFAYPGYPEWKVGVADRKTAEAIRQFNPQVLHLLNPLMLGLRLFDRLRRSGWSGPTLMSFHTLYAEFAREYGQGFLEQPLWNVIRAYHNAADVNLATSQYAIGLLRSHGVRRVELWPAGIDTHRFNPSRRSRAMRERLSALTPDAPLLLHVSRLAPEKNIAFLRDVLDRLPGAQLAIVGSGPDRERLEHVFAGSPTRFVGPLSGKELAQAFASADAFVYASLTETLGFVLLEAIASGTAVVAPRAGGVVHAVRDGKTGLLYEPGDADQAAALTREVMTQSPIRKAITREGVRASQAMTWEASMRSLEEWYRHAIDLHGAAGGVNGPGFRERLLLNAMYGATRAYASLRGRRVPPLLQRGRGAEPGPGGAAGAGRGQPAGSSTM